MQDIHPPDCLRIADLAEIDLGGLQVLMPQDYFRYYFQGDYNSPQKLDRVIRCMIACHRRKGETRWTGTCEGATTQHSRPEWPSKP
jgi:hypothetical protein